MNTAARRRFTEGSVRPRRRRPVNRLLRNSIGGGPSLDPKPDYQERRVWTEPTSRQLCIITRRGESELNRPRDSCVVQTVTSAVTRVMDKTFCTVGVQTCFYRTELKLTLILFIICWLILIKFPRNELWWLIWKKLFLFAFQRWNSSSIGCLTGEIEHWFDIVNIATADAHQQKLGNNVNTGQHSLWLLIIASLPMWLLIIAKDFKKMWIFPFLATRSFRQSRS